MLHNQVVPVDQNIVNEFFTSIERGDGEAVRDVLIRCKDATSVRKKSEKYRYEPEYELDAYKFLGAYIGPLTGIQVALLKNQEAIAVDILESTLDTEELEAKFGAGNSTLHLATFLGFRQAVKILLERGVDRNGMNAKGFRPIDLISADDDFMKQLYDSI